MNYFPLQLPPAENIAALPAALFQNCFIIFTHRPLKAIFLNTSRNTRARM
jgi:hypothetical protein